MWKRRDVSIEIIGSFLIKKLKQHVVWFISGALVKTFCFKIINTPLTNELG